MAHARLLGNKHLIKQLSLSLFPNLHTEVTDGSKDAVRSMLQNADAGRAISAPCKIQQPLTPAVLVVQKPTCEGLQGKKGEMDRQKQLEVTEEIDVQIRSPRSALGAERASVSKGPTDAQIRSPRRSALGAERASVSKGPTDFNQPISFLEYKRPYTTNYQKRGRVPAANDRFQEIFVKMPSEQQDSTTETDISSSPKGFTDQGLRKDCLEQKCKHSQRKRSHKPGPTTRNLFLGLDNAPLGIQPGTNPHITGNQHESFSDKVRLFIQKLTALRQEQGYPVQDYSEQLLENLGKTCQGNNDFLEETEEKCRWNPTGPETNHRSLTIKKVDWDFMGKESPLESLIRDYYNEILTKENLLARNWLNNDPSQLATTQNSG